MRGTSIRSGSNVIWKVTGEVTFGVFVFFIRLVEQVAQLQVHLMLFFLLLLTSVNPESYPTVCTSFLSGLKKPPP